MIMFEIYIYSLLFIYYGHKNKGCGHYIDDTVLKLVYIFLSIIEIYDI